MRYGFHSYFCCLIVTEFILVIFWETNPVNGIVSEVKFGWDNFIYMDLQIRFIYAVELCNPIKLLEDQTTSLRAMENFLCYFSCYYKKF